MTANNPNTYDPFVGTQIREYQIISKIGEGGMGAVYKAYHRILKQDRALKVMQKELLVDATFTARFMDEAKNLIMVNHKNVARFFEFFQHEDGTLFMAMEFVKGERLDHRLQSRGPLREKEVVFILCQVCAGIAEAHRQGIIHRDISPDNIMLVDQGPVEEVKILDFGIAKKPQDPEKTSVLTQPGTFIGKYKYSSPEQARGEKDGALDNRSDIYSLGVVTYEMLTGKTPFEAGNPQVFLLKQMTEEPIPLLERTPGVKCSPKLVQLIHKMLAKDRNQRPHDLEEVIRNIEDLDNLQDAPNASDKTIVQPSAEAMDEPSTKTQSVPPTKFSTAPETSPKGLFFLKNPKFRKAISMTAIAGVISAILIMSNMSDSIMSTAAITVSSIPSQANIYVDDELQPEKTTSSIENIKAGTAHTLRVEKDGFQPWIKEFKLEEGAVKAFTAKLKEE